MDTANGTLSILMHSMKWQYFDRQIPVLSLSVQYPEVTGSPCWKGQDRINIRIRTQVADFHRHASKTLYQRAARDCRASREQGCSFHPYRAAVKYTVTCRDGGFLSLFRDCCEWTGGESTAAVRFSDTWSLPSGRRLPLYRFFHFRLKYRRELLCGIFRQADRKMKEQPGFYWSGYRASLRRYFRPKNYYLTPEGAAVYYQPSEIAPPSAGILVFPVSCGHSLRR
ncbi:MAG: DUF3298 and DUF4163 domain-containing protein [Oscillospiraceae bacterium]|nr:DUF3298 and DUF4163 domain-containing protein [Oscillospiraceae bacterium]